MNGLNFTSIENGKEIKYQVTENMPADVKDKYKADTKGNIRRNCYNIYQYT